MEHVEQQVNERSDSAARRPGDEEYAEYGATLGTAARCKTS